MGWPTGVAAVDCNIRWSSGEMGVPRGISDVSQDMSPMKFLSNLNWLLGALQRSNGPKDHAEMWQLLLMFAVQG
jgi:hypothetical protein